MIGLKGNRRAYAPGEEIAGAVRWERKDAPSSAEVRLCWFTRGKGNEDAAVVETVSLESPRSGDTREFSFSAPEAPYSFSGTLISLIWVVELVLQPGDDFERVEIVIGPGKQEVLLLGGQRQKRRK
jgi:hypothetical protein